MARGCVCALACRLLAVLGGFCTAETRNLFWFSDSFDLRFPFGKLHWDVPVIGDVMVQVLHVGAFFLLFGGLEAAIMYRMRGVKLPPGKEGRPAGREWWSTSKQFGQGTLIAIAISSLWMMSFFFSVAGFDGTSGCR